MTEKHLFNPGTVVITKTFETLCRKGELDEHEVVSSYLQRHLSGDWGDFEEDSINEDALKVGNRLMSVYNLNDKGSTRFWVITEWDRSATTFLLPEDY